MRYPKEMVRPMRKELTDIGVKELRDGEAVDEAMEEASEGTALVVINSVCGCAAANARPAVKQAMDADSQPERYYTVFAGQDLEATERMREGYLAGIPPSSPFIALFKDGEPVFVLERRHIEGRSADAIASDLTEAYENYCSDNGEAPDKPERPETDGEMEADGRTSTFRSIM